jgi:hypothetical protein
VISDLQYPSKQLEIFVAPLPQHPLAAISSFSCWSQMVTAANHHSLEEATNWYQLVQDFGVPKVRIVMLKVFGESCTRIEAVAQTHYQRNLNIYEENLKGNMCDAGTVPFQPSFCHGSQAVVNT